MYASFEGRLWKYCPVHEWHEVENEKAEDVKQECTLREEAQAEPSSSGDSAKTD